VTVLLEAHPKAIRARINNIAILLFIGIKVE
jgi:hypothetical protein